MIINSQFFITHYNGKDPLPLKTSPTNLSDSDQLIYNKFIQSIGSIHSSQDINGKILKFWTKLTETKDELGNTKYTYIPHPDSTLEFLDSKSSYYFIVRDTSSLPITIPTLGGIVTNFADPSLLPQIEDIPLTNLGNTTGNSHLFTININNLQVNETYNYKFNCINSNWPANITPISGIIKSPKASGTLQSILTLFPTTENCSGSNLQYNLPASCLISNLNDKHLMLQLELTPQSYSGESVLSNEFTIRCVDCLPSAEITSNISEEERQKNKQETLSIQFKNFSLDKTYSYSIQALSATWPYYVSQPTGLIKITSNPSTLTLDSIFCPSTEQYPSNANNVLPYSAPANAVTRQSWYRPSVTLRAVIRDQDNSNIIHYSNVLKLTCQNYSVPSSINASVDIKDIPS